MRPFTTLIDAAALASQLERDDLAIFDCRFELGNPAWGESEFAREHVPGASYLHLDRDLSGPVTAQSGRHPLPEPREFGRRIAALGAGTDVQLVAYDQGSGAYAARFWWMARWIGIRNVAVLDGGIAAWQRAGGALTDQPSPPPVPTQTPYPDRPSLAPSVDAAGVATRPPRQAVLDARSGERFRGEAEPIDPVAGHIPGALNRFHKDNLDVGGVFKAPDRLRAEFGVLLGDRSPDEVIHSCGSGVTACHNLLAMEHAGLAGSLLYPGSWSEWSADPARPIARG